ncbi:hypothetical protein [Turicimonas sp. TL08]
MLSHRVNQTTEEGYLKTEKIRNIPDNSVPEMIDDLNYVGVTKCMGTSPVKYLWGQLTLKQRDYYKFARVLLPEGTFVLDSLHLGKKSSGLMTWNPSAPHWRMGAK